MGRHSDARERLIEAAGELWHTRSYADVGVSEICDHARVQKGSFYHFFSSKRELALAVIDERWQRHGVGEMAPILTGPLPPLERLELFLERGLQEQLQLKESTGVTVGCSWSPRSRNSSRRWSGPVRIGAISPTPWRCHRSSITARARSRLEEKKW